MSRSRRKMPIFSNSAAETDHPWKKAAARRLRRCVKQRLESELNADRFAGKRWDLVNPCTSDKDGKWYSLDPAPEWMRK